MLNPVAGFGPRLPRHGLLAPVHPLPDLLKRQPVPAACAPAPAVSPKPTAAPPVLPGVLHLEEEGEQPDDPRDTAVEVDLPAASNPTPVASPKPSAAPPLPPQAIDLEEEEAPPGVASEAIEIPDEPAYNILVVSEGIRYRDNSPFPFQGHQVWCDLRDVANPERDRRLQAHLGYHPLNIQNLMVNETFMRKIICCHERSIGEQGEQDPFLSATQAGIAV